MQMWMRKILGQTLDEFFTNVGKKLLSNFSKVGKKSRK